jgi:dephospho-CoA kinase
MVSTTHPINETPSKPGDFPILRVGLTGGIGCGKSAVANILKSCGAAIIDTDLIAHEITAPGGLAIPGIAQEFGSEMILPDGSLDRSKMRELVFNDPSAKLALEQITHPLIRQIGEERAYAALQQKPPYLVFVVPLLVESGQWLLQAPPRIDYVVVVDCPESQQISRVQSRSGLSIDVIHKIMASQAKREDRLAIADYVIENQESLQALEDKTRVLHKLLTTYKK